MTEAAASGLYISEVDVRIIRGIYRPCNQCHWYSSCVVPRGQHLQNLKNPISRIIYHCVDFTAKTP